MSIIKWLGREEAAKATPPRGYLSLNLNRDIDTSGQVKLLKLIDRACSGVDDVQKPLVGADLKLLSGLLIDVRRAVDAEFFNASGQRDGTGYLGARALGGINDLFGGAVESAVVVGPKADADVLIFHGRGRVVCFYTAAARSPPRNSTSSRTMASGTGSNFAGSIE